MIREEQWHGKTVYTLENDELLVTLCPAYGNNLIRVWDKKAQREVLREPESPEQLDANPGHYGTPLMLPPNRIRNGRFVFEGREYQFPINNAGKHHIHGFLRNHAWRFVSEPGENALRSVFAVKEHEDVAEYYPHDLSVEVVYTLKGASLLHHVTVKNSGDRTAPFGYGLHTWFRIDGEPEKWRLQLPVSDIWELDADLMPTGSRLPLSEHAALNNAEGISLAERKLDTVYRIGDRPVVATLSREDGYEIRYSGSDEFRHWVIFTQGKADQFICLEPYTSVTDAMNLELPQALTGFRGIASGETLELDVLLEISRGRK